MCELGTNLGSCRCFALCFCLRVVSCHSKAFLGSSPSSCSSHVTVKYGDNSQLQHVRPTHPPTQPQRPPLSTDDVKTPRPDCFPEWIQTENKIRCPRCGLAQPMSRVLFLPDSLSLGLCGSPSWSGTILSAKGKNSEHLTQLLIWGQFSCRSLKSSTPFPRRGFFIGGLRSSFVLHVFAAHHKYERLSREQRTHKSSLTSRFHPLPDSASSELRRGFAELDDVMVKLLYSHKKRT